MAELADVEVSGVWVVIGGGECRLFSKIAEEEEAEEEEAEAEAGGN